MQILSGKKGVIMGVANSYSIATSVADVCHKQGAALAFNHLPDSGDRARNAQRAKQIAEPLEAKLIAPCDVANDEDIASFFSKVGETFGSIDFLVHSIAFAPTDELRGGTIDCSRAGFKLAMDISVYSLIATAREAAKLMPNGGSILAMTYIGGERVVAGYNIMGVCKAALESTIKYLAYDLGPKGVRVNGVSAGPIKTLAASAIGNFSQVLKTNAMIAPLGRNVTGDEVGKASAFLLSDLASSTTGEIMHVDGGYNIMGNFGKALAQLMEGGEK